MSAPRRDFWARPKAAPATPTSVNMAVAGVVAAGGFDLEKRDTAGSWHERARGIVFGSFPPDDEIRFLKDVVDQRRIRQKGVDVSAQCPLILRDQADDVFLGRFGFCGHSGKHYQKTGGPYRFFSQQRGGDLRSPLFWRSQAVSINPSAVSCFRRSWPQAASISWPFSMRRVAVTPAFFKTSWKARQWDKAGRFHSSPSTVL